MTQKHGTDGHQTVKTAGPVKLNKIEETLAERKQQHGPYMMHCEIEYAIMGAIAKTTLTKEFDPVIAVSIHMIVHKLSRILNSGHMHADTWHDIAGYATLAEKHVRE